MEGGGIIGSSMGGYYPLATGAPEYATYSHDYIESRAIASGIGFVAGDMKSAMDERAGIARPP